MKEKTKYAAVVDVSRKEIDNGKYIRFAADVRFANGAVITKYMDVPPPHTCTQEYNPNDDMQLLLVYPTLMTLLNNGDAVLFNGKLTDGLLRGAWATNEYYNNIATDFHLINIECKNIVPALLPAGACDSVLAYSGGVDANYSLVSHKRGLVGAKNTNIRVAVSVCGLALGMSETDKFNEYAKYQESVLSEYGVDFLPVFIPQEGPIDLQYMWKLAAALHLFANVGNFAYGLIGSDGTDYLHIHLSTFADNPMSTDDLSSRAFRVFTDGQNKSRVEKCEILASEPTIMKNLMVCFDSDIKQNLNCGYCVKCVRTILDFWALGVYDLPFLSRPLNMKRFYRAVKTVVAESSPEGFFFYLDVVRRTKKSERNKYWYRFLKKCCDARKNVCIGIDKVFEPETQCEYHKYIQKIKSENGFDIPEDNWHLDVKRKHHSFWWHLRHLKF